MVMTAGNADVINSAKSRRPCALKTPAAALVACSLILTHATSAVQAQDSQTDEPVPQQSLSESEAPMGGDSVEAIPPVRNSAANENANDAPLDVSDAQIRLWVDELDDADFQKRMQATRQLGQLGARSVPFLVDSLDTSRLEGVTRAMRLLERFYRSNTERAVSSSEAVLEGLVSGETAASQEVAYEAQRVLTANSDVRSERALAQIRRLGGVVKFESMRAAVFVNGQAVIGGDHLSHIIIGEGWTGGDEGLRYLKRLEGLQSLYVTGDAVSTEALDDLVRTVPSLKVQIRGSACLGIGSGPNPTGVAGCWITRVEPNSAAEKGGITTGDIITRFGDQTIENFDQLVEAIKTKKAGDRVIIGIQRRNQELELPVVLGAWDNK